MGKSADEEKEPELFKLQDIALDEEPKTEVVTTSNKDEGAVKLAVSILRSRCIHMHVFKGKATEDPNIHIAQFE